MARLEGNRRRKKELTPLSTKMRYKEAKFRRSSGVAKRVAALIPTLAAHMGRRGTHLAQELASQESQEKRQMKQQREKVSRKEIGLESREAQDDGSAYDKRIKTVRNADPRSEKDRGKRACRPRRRPQVCPPWIQGQALVSARSGNRCLDSGGDQKHSADWRPAGGKTEWPGVGDGGEGFGAALAPWCSEGGGDRIGGFEGALVLVSGPRGGGSQLYGAGGSPPHLLAPVMSEVSAPAPLSSHVSPAIGR